MAASASDYFLKVRQNFSTTVGSGGVADGTVTTVPLTSVSNLPTDTAIELVINRVTSAGVETNNYETVRGVISGSNLTNVVRGVEGTAQGWDAGVVVEFLVTADIQNRMVTGLLVEHGQDGVHSTATFDKLAANQTITGLKTFSQSAIFQSGFTVQGPVSESGVHTFSQSALFQSGFTATLPIITTPTIRNWDAWIDANETWAYASVNTITVPSGAAAKFAVGDRIKWTQTSVKYGVIIAVADTLLTIAVNTDYTVADAAISANYYSHEASPIGYPTWFTYTPAFTGFSSNPSGLSTKFCVVGKMCTVEFIAAGLGTSNANNFVISLPIANLVNQGLTSAIIVGAVNNNTNIIAGASLYNGFIYLLKDYSTSGWTTSGAKGLYAITISYGI